MYRGSRAVLSIKNEEVYIHPLIGSQSQSLYLQLTAITIINNILSLGQDLVITKTATWSHTHSGGQQLNRRRLLSREPGIQRRRGCFIATADHQRDLLLWSVVVAVAAASCFWLGSSSHYGYGSCLILDPSHLLIPDSEISSHPVISSWLHTIPGHWLASYIRHNFSEW